MNVFQVVGIGEVAADKPSDTLDISVFIKSRFPLADGEVVAQTQTLQANSPDKNNQIKSSTVLHSNTEPATWMGDGNRLTAPDVKKGSKVVLYRFADQKKMLWTTYGLNQETFRLEHIMWGYSANPNLNKNTPFNSDNFYIVTLSTSTGEISLKTSMSNKEPARMVFVANTQKGTWGYTDTQKNNFGLDIMKHKFFFLNQEKSMVQIERDKIMISAGDSKSNGTVSIDGMTNVSIVTNKLDINAKQINIQSDNITINNSGTVLVTSPNINVKGDVKIEGNLEVTENIKAKSMEVDTMKVNDTMSLNGLNMNNHVHGNGNDGDDTYGPK